MFDERKQASDDLRDDLAALHDEAWRWGLSCCRGDREAAMEAVQDAYLLMLSGKAPFAGRSSFRSFVFGVVRNCARAARRRAAFRNLLFAPIEAADTACVPADQERAVDAARAERAMAALSRRQGEVARLVLIHGFTVTEAAEALALSRGAASKHFAEAKLRLRAVLAIKEDAHDG